MKPLQSALVLALLALACGGGCTTVVLPAVGTAAAMGIDYTAKNCPSKTFTCETECVHDGVHEALENMSLTVTTEEKKPWGYQLKAKARGLTVKVDMVRLSETTTKVGVDAAKNIILRDGATAREILAQIEEALDRRGALRAKAMPESRPSAAALSLPQG